MEEAEKKKGRLSEEIVGAADMGVDLDESTSSSQMSEVLEVASLAGHILLENGAEISRVEDIMSRISTHYGVQGGNFFVISNGIFTTGSVPEKLRKRGTQAECYANVEFIPIKSADLGKVALVNSLSYDIASGKYTLLEAKAKLEEIRLRPQIPLWETILGAAIGAGGFCAIFGGSLIDCAADFAVGALVCLFSLFVSGRYLSKIVGNILNAVVTGLVCLLLWRVGFGEHLSNIVIGGIMPLVPGIPFVNGVRDIANGDYLAGVTRLTDALLGFLCISLGIAGAFILDGWMWGGMTLLSGVQVSPQTSSYLAQGAASFIGTVGFAILFSVPRKLRLASGAIGALGWEVYLLITRLGPLTPQLGTLVAAFLICIMARYAAVWGKVPANIFVLCGIFTLVPGAGLFWTTYYLLLKSFSPASTSGFAAITISLAIVFGIIFAMELPQKWFSFVAPRRKKE